MVNSREDSVIKRLPKLFCFAAVIFILACSTGSAALVYLYDFPGTPGSGLAANQTNPQPSGATFSDFTRTNLNPDIVPRSNEFDTIGWSLNGQDLTKYEGFTITASPGHLLDLTSLTFSTVQYLTGATQGQVALFLNGSTTAYATLNYQWANSPVTFNFTPLTNANNVTVAEFRFYGWMAGALVGSDGLANVATNGTIALVPEIPTFWPLLFFLGFVTIIETTRGMRRRRRFSVARPWFEGWCSHVKHLIRTPMERYRSPTAPLWKSLARWVCNHMPAGACYFKIKVWYRSCLASNAWKTIS